MLFGAVYLTPLSRKHNVKRVCRIVFYEVFLYGFLTQFPYKGFTDIPSIVNFPICRAEVQFNYNMCRKYHEDYMNP